MGKETSKLMENLKEFKVKIKKEFKVKKIILFGSRVHNYYGRDSDVDLIIVSDWFKGKTPLERSPKLYLEWNLDYPVDFLCYSIKEFEENKKRNTIVRQALKEGITI